MVLFCNTGHTKLQCYRTLLYRDEMDSTSMWTGERPQMLQSEVPPPPPPLHAAPACVHHQLLMCSYSQSTYTILQRLNAPICGQTRPLNTSVWPRAVSCLKFIGAFTVLSCLSHASRRRKSACSLVKAVA